MFRVDIYTAVKSSSNSKTLGKYGFVCTCAKKSGEVGKIQDTGRIKGTRHETEVKAITEALSRLNQSCEVHIHCEDNWKWRYDIMANRMQSYSGSEWCMGNGNDTPTRFYWKMEIYNRRIYHIGTDMDGRSTII